MGLIGSLQAIVAGATKICYKCDTIATKVDKIADMCLLVAIPQGCICVLFAPLDINSN